MQVWKKYLENLRKTGEKLLEISGCRSFQNNKQQFGVILKILRENCGKFDRNARKL